MCGMAGTLARQPVTNSKSCSNDTHQFVRRSEASCSGRHGFVVRCSHQGDGLSNAQASRRNLLSASILSTGAAALAVQPANAVQGLTAGRIPGLSKETDSEGFRTYTRPEGKSGGHGVGWSEIPPYQFKVPDGWKEVPVSIADLGGTEIDLRFGNDKEGNMAIVVAPVLRFLDVGFNADIRIEQLGDPDKLINGFGPELFGAPLQEGDVMNTEVVERQGLKYYNWELKPHRLVAATAYKNRVFLMALEANGRQWRKSQDRLRKMQKSFGLAKLQA